MDSIQLATGITTFTHKTNTQNIFNYVICSHGLGARNPRLRNHLNDDWINIINKDDVPSSTQLIKYTARGHGETTGWQNTAESDLHQFSWSRLADDMVAVADFYDISKFVAAGSSMGASTSLYAAMKYPNRISGVIMIRPPTAWETRKARKKNLLKSASKCQELNALEDKYHYVLYGAAETDLPPLDESHHYMYESVICPILILTVEGDDSHPVSTALLLQQHLTQAEVTLHIAKSDEDTNSIWPPIIHDFLLKIQSTSI